MDLARDYIMKALTSCQRALDDLEKGGIQGIKLALGDLDYVEHRIEASKILLRDELKEMKNI